MRGIAAASVWALLTLAIGQVLRTGVNLVYAFFLSPGEFGIFFFGMSVVGFALSIIDYGPGQALIQSDRNETSLFNVTFNLTLSISASMGLAMFIAAPTIASWLGQDDAESPLKFLALYVVVVGLSRTHIAIARRRLHFRQIMWIETAISVTPLVVGVPLAATGYGVWAPVISTVLGASVGVIFAWVLVEWRPEIRFDVKVATDVLRFSRWTMLDGMLSWLSSWGAAFFIGIQLSAHETGLFRTGEMLPRITFTAMLGSLVPVMFSALSRLKYDIDASANVVHEFSRFIGLAGAIFGTGLLVGAGAIEAILGEKWNGIAVVIMVLTAGEMFSSILTPLQPYLQASGRPQFALAFRLAVVSLLLPVYILVIPYGIVATVWALLGVKIVLLVVGLRIIARTASIGIGPFINEPARLYLEAALVGIIAWLLVGQVAPVGALVTGLLNALLFILLFTVYAMVMHRHTLARAWQLFKSVTLTAEP